MRTGVATLLAFGLLTGTASAQATATATPAKAGKGTVLRATLDATQPPVMGRVPVETVLSIQSGYRFDGRAVAKRCGAEAADADSCPRPSEIGEGRIVASVLGTTMNVPIDLYLSKPHERGDVAGFYVVAEVQNDSFSAPGRVVRATEKPYGLSVVIPTPNAEQVASFGVTLESFEARVGTSRKVKVGKRRVRRHLITNPSRCTGGSWASMAALTFTDGTSATLDAPIACKP